MSRASKIAKKVSKLSTPAKIVVAILVVAILVAFVYAYMQGWLDKYLYPDNNNVGGSGTTVEATGELEIHFMELGNKANGDSIYIRAGDVDIIVDGGSEKNSADDICQYVDQYCTDNTIEFAIVTHADTDHIASFIGTTKETGIFDYYEVDTIIDFPLTDKADKATCSEYFRERTEEIEDGNTDWYTALQCYNNEDGAQRIYQLTDSITLEILYHKFYEERHSDENNYSVCFLLTHGSEKFLFTGDLEEHGEESLIEQYGNRLADVTLFKAGHHGSRTSSNEELLSVIKPEIVVVTCVAGRNQYHAAEENIFPTQAMIDRVSQYTDEVYVTTMYDEVADEGVSMNGDITIISTTTGVTVRCSNNDTYLKDTQWFADNRTMPDAWGRAS